MSGSTVIACAAVLMFACGETQSESPEEKAQRERVERLLGELGNLKTRANAEKALLELGAPAGALVGTAIRAAVREYDEAKAGKLALIKRLVIYFDICAKLGDSCRPELERLAKRKAGAVRFEACKVLPAGHCQS